MTAEGEILQPFFYANFLFISYILCFLVFCIPNLLYEFYS